MPKESLVRWLKCALLMLVVILWVSSCCLLYLASWIRDNLNPLVDITGGTVVGDFYIHSFFPVLFPVLIASSFLLLVIGFLGLCGAFSENKVLLAWFFIAILVTFCVEISAGVWGKLDWNLQYQESDIDLLYKYAMVMAPQHHQWFTSTWSDIHVKFHCCGVRSYRDWENVPHLKDTCAESTHENNQSKGATGCGETLLRYLTGSSPIRAIPYLATLIGATQILCLIVTVKLWMILCFGANPKPSSKTAQKLNPSNRNDTQQSDVKMCTQYRQNPTRQPNSVERRDQAFEMRPIKLHVDVQNTRQKFCSQCAMKALEETQLISPYVLEAECDDIYLQTRVPRRLRTPMHWSMEGMRTTPTGVHADSGYRTLSARNLRTPKTVSYNIPTYQRSSSWSVMRNCSRNCRSATLPRRQCSRDCHSATLPRRKISYHSPRWRHPSTGNFVNRLSTIRASGVAAESDSSSNTDCSQNVEELGGSRCYNTEAELSYSDLENCATDTSKSDEELLKSASGHVANNGDCPADSASTECTMLYPTI